MRVFHFEIFFNWLYQHSTHWNWLHLHMITSFNHVDSTGKSLILLMEYDEQFQTEHQQKLDLLLLTSRLFDPMIRKTDQVTWDSSYDSDRGGGLVVGRVGSWLREAEIDSFKLYSWQPVVLKLPSVWKWSFAAWGDNMLKKQYWAKEQR